MRERERVEGGGGVRKDDTRDCRFYTLIILGSKVRASGGALCGFVGLAWPCRKRRAIILSKRIL